MLFSGWGVMQYIRHRTLDYQFVFDFRKLNSFQRSIESFKSFLFGKIQHPSFYHKNLVTQILTTLIVFNILNFRKISQYLTLISSVTKTTDHISNIPKERKLMLLISQWAILYLQNISHCISFFSLQGLPFTTAPL